MDPISAIVGALVAGASAAATDVASKAVKDAYDGLKALILTAVQAQGRCRDG